MFENNPGTHVNVIKYVLVGILLTVSIIALGWGVWIYTYNQNLAEPTPVESGDAPAARYSAEEWEAIRNADTGSSTPRYEEDEWEAIRSTEAEPATTSASYSEDEWNAIRNGG